MKKKITAILIICFLCSFSIHKFYVGVFELDYHSGKKEFQVTCRLFIDDIEKAIQKKFNKKIYLGTTNESLEAKNYLTGYFNEKFKLTINGKEQTLTLHSTEYEDDVLICYIKFPYAKKISSIKLTNNLLCEMFSDQQNLVHTSILGTKKSFLFTHSNDEQNILIK